MLIALLIAAQAPVALAPVLAPNVVSTVRAKPVAQNDVCPTGAPAGIIVQGGKTADAGIIVQGGKTAGAGIIVQGGLQPSGPSDSAAKGKCDKPKR